MATTNTFGIADTELDRSNCVQVPYCVRVGHYRSPPSLPTGMAGHCLGTLVDYWWTTQHSYSQHLWPTTNFALAHNTMFDRSNCVQVTYGDVHAI